MPKPTSVQATRAPANQSLTRRSFLQGIASLATVTALAAATRGAESPQEEGSLPIRGDKFKPWTRGCLDLHHISTGRGSSMLAICPDGTVFMVDAGAIYTPLKYTIAPKPDNSRRPGEWIARYVGRHLKAASREEIDFLLVSHFHSDHIGDYNEKLPLSKTGDYRLTGITDIAEAIPIRKIFDRGFPGYDYPPAYYPPEILNLAYENYKQYIEHRKRSGEAVERFKAGSGRQLGLVRDPAAYPTFEIRNLSSNGHVWKRTGDLTENLFPEIAGLSLRNYPDENMCSNAIRLNYGGFSYYSGGDLTNEVGYDNVLWRDIESPVARAAGRVSVAVVNHHGYVNGAGPAFVRALEPKAFIVQAWDSAHPTIRPLANMLSEELYSGPRDVFTTAIKEENVIATRDLARARSLNGHVVVRVAENAEQFYIEIISNADESDTVVATHGPYMCG